MKDLEVGQVLSCKIRYNNDGVIAKRKHPYLIVDICDETKNVYMNKEELLKINE